MKHCLILSSNFAYLPSLKAIFGALKHYQYKNTEVHLIYYSDMKFYVDEAVRRMPFKITPIDIYSLAKPGHCLYHDLVYSKYKHAWNIRNDYDSIMHLDCDCLILNNFEKWMEVAAKTDIIPCAKFPHTPVTIDFYKTYPDKDWVNCMLPLANFPIFYNPKIHADIMLKIWESQPDETNSDRLRNHEMYFFNKTIYEMGRMENILELPGNLWVTDKFVGISRIVSGIVEGKLCVYCTTGDRIEVIHNKFWKEGVAEGEISRSKNNTITVQNITDIKSYIDFLTKEEAK